jgi:hypothetical protein
MSTDSGPSKKLIIAGVIIFIVLIGTVLFFLFNTIESSTPVDEEQFADFPVSPPDNIYTAPTVQVVNDPVSTNLPRQQNAQDEIRPIIPQTEEAESEPDQSELDALAYLNAQPRTASGAPVGASTDTGPDPEDEGLSYEEIFAAFEANPGMLQYNEQTADYFGDWTPAQTTEEFFMQARDERWGIEDRVDIDKVISDLGTQKIVDIADTSIKNCGNINVVLDAETSESELSSELSNDTSALCLANSLVDECDPVMVTNAGISYLAGDFGNGCSAGTLFSEFANLCEISPDPTSLRVERDSELGDLVASIFFSSNVSNCQLYQL